MSSTNVHSKSDKPVRAYCVCGQSIPKENGELEMPPKTAKRGPSTTEVIQGPEMEIAAFASELRQDGKLISEGKVVEDLGREAFSEIKGKYDKNKNIEGKDTGRGE